MFIVQIAGRLGKDPETRFTPSGQKVTSFNVATNQRKGKEDVTVWVRVVVWGERLDKMISYLKKGSAVVVIGKMNPPSIYTDKEGRPQCSLEITAEMIEFSPFGREDKPDNQTTQNTTYQNNPSFQQNSAPNDFSAQEDTAYGGNFSGGGYKQNAYANQVMSGQGSQNNNTEDDSLPF